MTESSSDDIYVMSMSDDGLDMDNPFKTDIDGYIGEHAWIQEFPDNEYRGFLQVDISNIISEITGAAWGIAVDIPITIQFDLDGNICKPTKIYVYQLTVEIKLYQLQTLLQKFVDCLWKFGKNISDKSYFKRYKEEINAYPQESTDALLLHKLYKNDIETALNFYDRKQNNLFNLIREYLIYRLPTICQYCIHCDTTPMFLQERTIQLLKPFVCGNHLCYFQLSQLKMGTTINGVTTGSSNLMYLLSMMTVCAVKSKEWRDKILKPFPTLISHENPTEFYLHETDLNYDLLEEIAEGIPLDKLEYTKSNTQELCTIMNNVHPYAYDLLQWIISSNRGHITDIPEELILPDTGTSEQYLMLLDSPAKETRFQELKAEYGTVYAFHGTRFMNYHSILRNGLYNASGTKLQRNGTVHGKGIYLSPSLKFALGYCKGSKYRCLAL